MHPIVATFKQAALQAATVGGTDAELFFASAWQPELIDWRASRALLVQESIEQERLWLVIEKLRWVAAEDAPLHDGGIMRQG